MARRGGSKHQSENRRNELTMPARRAGCAGRPQQLGTRDSS